MTRRKPAAKKPRQKRPKEATPPEPPQRAEVSAPPREPPIIRPKLPLPPEPPHSQYKPSAALVIAVVLTAVLEVLDITIVSVAIPHMLGTFGATSDQITWVLTSYLVSAAVVMPLTGYLSARLGRRRLLIFSIVGFVISSALCGLSWNLESMVIFRLAQGICGAPLVPLSQAILLDAFPKEKHGQALAIFGLGIMVAPVLGPTFGGWLTDTFVWRAVFYINVPIGLFALLLAMGNLPRSDIRYLKTGWIGLVLLVLAVGSLQMVLDQGQTRDWFNSRFIQFFTAIAVFASVAFFMRGWNNPKNIVDLSLLKDRNFLAGLLAITAYGVTLFGTIALLPLLTQRLMGYPAMNAGMLFIPRAVASAIDSSSSVSATFMPRPPPPAAAFTSTGKPMARAMPVASASDDTPPSEPGTQGMPNAFAVRLASILSPIWRMCSALGPMNEMLCSARISAKRAFSDRKP